MKFNWGHGIALFYGTFALSFIVIVIQTTRHDHSLVTQQYYQKDLEYQSHYEKLANSQKLTQALKIWTDTGAQALSIQFPGDLGNDVKGEVTFYRPVNSNEDFTVPFQLLDETILEYNTKDMQPGLWTIKVDWQAGETPYYQEINISI